MPKQRNLALHPSMQKGVAWDRRGPVTSWFVYRHCVSTTFVRADYYHRTHHFTSIQ